jgi:transcription initiation factor IIE alpha subunit
MLVLYEMWCPFSEVISKAIQTESSDVQPQMSFKIRSETKLTGFQLPDHHSKLSFEAL